MGEIYDATIGQITGSTRAADNAGRAAQEQEAELRRAVGFAREGLDAATGQMAGIRQQGDAAIGTANRGLSDAMRREGAIGNSIMDAINSAQSPQEMAALMRNLQTQERNLVRQEQVLANIDPAVMEASQQSLAILRGEESQFLDPIRQDRERQREKLVGRLREQLGPGAESSTAGIQALNQFDQETNLTLSQQRQGTLDQLFGMANQGAMTGSSMNAQNQSAMAQTAAGFGTAAGRNASTRLGGLSSALNAGAQTQNAYGNVGQTQLGALDRNLSGMGMQQQGFANLVNAQSGMAAGAGGEFVAGQLRGQAQNQFVNDRIQSGENMAGQAMGSASSCCFIFMEARYGTGAMDSVVRRFRDENMTPRNKRGYYKVSEVLVPLMRKCPVVRFLVRATMTDPLVSYGKYHYGEGKIGVIFTPVKKFWLGLFDYLGQDHKFLRDNGETV